MVRDRIDIEELLFDQSQHYPSPAEEASQKKEAALLSRNPKMIEALYEVPAELATAIACAIETEDVTILAALIAWDIDIYLDENGGVEQWLN